MTSMKVIGPVAVVTGANKGIGFEVCRQLANLGYSIVLTGRDLEKAESAAQTLKSEGFHVDALQLDVADMKSIEDFGKNLKERFPKIEILVNNAGVFLDHGEPGNPDAASIFEVNRSTLDQTIFTNTYGPIFVSQVVVPLMKGEGRIVNVSSGMGQLTDMNGRWPAYRISKTALNAVTRILADELKDTAIKVNSVCPGWVRTEMGGPNASRSVEKGAETIVWAATLPEDGPTGGFFRDQERVAW